MKTRILSMIFQIPRNNGRFWGDCEPTKQRTLRLFGTFGFPTQRTNTTHASPPPTRTSKPQRSKVGLAPTKIPLSLAAGSKSSQFEHTDTHITHHYKECNKGFEDHLCIQSKSSDSKIQTHLPRTRIVTGLWPKNHESCVGYERCSLIDCYKFIQLVRCRRTALGGTSIVGCCCVMIAW